VPDWNACLETLAAIVLPLIGIWAAVKLWRRD
jgi:hypothetical protein